jgi:hypothetical protein
MWQPAEGGEAISAAEAGYGTIVGGEAAPETAAVAATTTEVAPETRDLDDEEPLAPAAEDAAVHVAATVADEAGDELAADADLDAEEPDVRTEEEAEIEETAGDQS